MDDPRASIEGVYSVHQEYRSLASKGGDVEEVVKRRLALSLWRRNLMYRYLQQPPGWSPRDRADYLQAIGTYIPEKFRTRIAQTLAPRDFAALMAQHGVRTRDLPDYNQLAGPDRYLPIDANRSSRWPFTRWSQDSLFSEYFYEDGMVFYRGNQFLPGDVLLTNTNRDGNGIYTAHGVPLGLFPHSGFFAVLEQNGRDFPCVMETYEFGVRAVPLNAFLHPRFASYIEIYRHREATTQHSGHINSCARALMENTKGYNFDTEDPERNYVSCTTIGQFMFQDAGLPQISKRSHCSSAALENLNRLGYSTSKMMFPIDYLRDPLMQCVGCIDNHHSSKLLARWFVDRELSRQLQELQLEPKALPLHSKINLWAIRQVRNQTGLASLLELISGFNQYTLPKGPDPILALVTVWEKVLGKQVRRLDRHLCKHYLRDPLAVIDYEALLDDRDLMEFTRRLVRVPWLRERN